MATTPRADSADPGAGVPRIDGAAKVTGEARYASDVPVANPAYAFLVHQRRSRAAGSPASTRRRRARVPGVLDILTHENVGGRSSRGKIPSRATWASTIAPLDSDRVWHDGQIVAVVVADTFEAAREAAHRLRVAYAAEPPTATFDSPGVEVEPREGQEQQARRTPAGRRRRAPPSPPRR